MGSRCLLGLSAERRIARTVVKKTDLHSFNLNKTWFNRKPRPMLRRANNWAKSLRVLALNDPLTYWYRLGSSLLIVQHEIEDVS